MIAKTIAMMIVMMVVICGYAELYMMIHDDGDL